MTRRLGAARSLGLGLGLTLTLTLTLAACTAATPPPVDLSGQWPQAASAYRDAHARWTRRARVTDGLDFIMSVAVTALSPDFRAAVVDERARRLHMGDDARAEALAAEKTAEAEAYEFVIVVSTWRYEWNDFARGAQSMWRVALVSDDGREVLADKVTVDKRSRAEIGSWFRDVGAFHKTYVVSFPRKSADGQPLFGGDARKMTLKIASSLGGAELVWSAK